MKTMAHHTSERIANLVSDRLAALAFEILEPYGRCHGGTDLCVVRDEEYGYLYLNFRHPFLKDMIFLSRRELVAFEAKVYEVTKLKVVINPGTPIYLH